MLRNTCLKALVTAYVTILLFFERCESNFALLYRYIIRVIRMKGEISIFELTNWRFWMHCTGNDISRQLSVKFELQWETLWFKKKEIGRNSCNNSVPGRVMAGRRTPWILLTPNSLWRTLVFFMLLSVANMKKSKMLGCSKSGLFQFLASVWCYRHVFFKVGRVSLPAAASAFFKSSFSCFLLFHPSLSAANSQDPFLPCSSLEDRFTSRHFRGNRSLEASLLQNLCNLQTANSKMQWTCNLAQCGKILFGFQKNQIFCVTNDTRWK